LVTVVIPGIACNVIVPPEAFVDPDMDNPAPALITRVESGLKLVEPAVDPDRLNPDNIPEAEMLIEDAPEVNPIFWLATRETLDEVAFRLKLVATAPAGTEIVTDPAPTPTLAIPAPENWRTLLNVPVELEVVLPRAVREIVEKLVTEGVLAEIVMLPAPTPADTIPAPEMTRALLYVPVELLVVFPLADNEIVEKLVATGTDM
jgi:hypothetical protein